MFRLPELTETSKNQRAYENALSRWQASHGPLVIAKAYMPGSDLWIYNISFQDRTVCRTFYGPRLDGYSYLEPSREAISEWQTELFDLVYA